MRKWFIPILLVALLAPARASSATDTPLQVLICLDGVPLSMMEKLKAEGHFSAFKTPAPLISTFPAITEIMLTEFFGVAPPPGYGLRYYDKDSNVLQGGLSDASAISIWFSLYDFVTPMFDRGLTYLWGRWGVIDIDYAERVLRNADGMVMMHLDSTDALMHNEPPRVTERWLKKFDASISDFLARNQHRDVEVILFSDHGNDMTAPVRIDIEKHLKAKGFTPGSVVDGDSGVAILPTGLISTAYMYTAREAEVASALRDLEGVDFAVYERDGVVFVEGSGGTARVEKDEKRFRYVPIDGDPLKLEKVVSEMRASGVMDADGWAGDREWFEKTLEHEYPDVLRRVHDGLTGHVKNVGDVLLSLKNGYHCGSKFLQMVVHFNGTHGSLARGSSTGFILSSRRELPFLRAEEALDQLGWRQAVVHAAASRNVTVRETPHLSCVGCGSSGRSMGLSPMELARLVR